MSRPLPLAERVHTQPSRTVVRRVLIAPLLALVFGFGAGSTGASPSPSGTSPSEAWEPTSPLDESGDVARSSKPNPGQLLFDHHCASCHGNDGSPPPVISRLFVPPPRNFRDGVFHLVSTENGVPTDLDLMHTIARGMPGSAMPGFAWLGPEKLYVVSNYVRRLAILGRAEALAEDSVGNDPISEEARAQAKVDLTPGAVLPKIAPLASPTQDTLEMGRWLYLEKCAACHGVDGKGREGQKGWNPWADYKWARDFTAGILRGGSSIEELSYRIRAGMPGSSMPPTRLQNPDQSVALLTYVVTLIPKDSERHLLQVRRSLTASRIPGPVPSRGDDPTWNDLPEENLNLSPIAWKDDAILSAKLSLVHDGTTVAVRVRWRDESPDRRAFQRSAYGDGAALQFSSETDPPLFAMGSDSHPVTLWHWQSFRFRDVAGLLDLLQNHPHARDQTSGQRDDRIDRRKENPRSESLVVRGADSIREAPRNPDSLETSSDWTDGHWTLVFRRSLQPRAPEEIELKPGARVFLSLAIWNGAAGDHGGQKSFSIWHPLSIGE